MKKLLLLSLAFTSSICFTNAQWQQTKGPNGENINLVAACGTNIFAVTGNFYGTEPVNAFLSTDTGGSWTMTNNGTSYNAFAIIGNNIFMGTNQGLYLSTDTGTTWTAASDSNGLQGNSITSLTVSGTNIFAGTGSNGVFTSSDTGASWMAINNGIIGAGNYAISSLAVSGKNIFAATAFGYVFLSTNNGANWTGAEVNFSTDITSLAAIGTNIFAMTVGGLFRSTDNGASWTANNEGGGGINSSLAVIGTNIFAASYGGVFLSTDTGASWTAVKNGLQMNIDSLVSSLAVIGTNIFAGTGLGVFLSTDTGASWTEIGLPNGNVNSLAVSGTNIFAGAGDNFSNNYQGGIFLSTNNGKSWRSTGGPDGVTAFAVSGTNIFAEAGWIVYLSTNNGESWTAVNNGLPSYTTVYSFAVSGTSIFAGTGGGVFLSTDTGSNWMLDTSGMGEREVTSLALRGTNIFAGTNSDGVFLSTNTGSSWTAVNNGLPLDSVVYLNVTYYSYPSVSSLAISGANIFAATTNGVFLSSNNATNWTAINNGLTDSLDVFSFAVSGTNIFAATGGGVFLSTDTGRSWVAFNNDFTDSSSVTSLALCGTDIFAGTGNGGLTGGGVWRHALIDVLPCASNFSLAADTTQLHHYIATNMAFGKQPINYDWSWGDGSHDYTPYPSHTYADSGFYNICLSITDSGGCQSTYCDSSFHAMRTTNTMVYVNVVNPLITGTKEVNVQTSQVTIYPNPATDQLYINSNQSGKNTITIYNVLGQEASPPTPLQKRGENAIVDISKLPAGMYFVKVSNETSRWTGKFVKE